MNGFTLFLVIVGTVALTRQLFRLMDKIEHPPRRGRREVRKERKA